MFAWKDENKQKEAGDGRFLRVTKIEIWYAQIGGKILIFVANTMMNQFISFCKLATLNYDVKVLINLSPRLRREKVWTKLARSSFKAHL